MITKNYPIITIDITQIIDSILNQNLSFVILKLVHWIGPNRTKWAKIDRIRPNGPKWIESTEYTELDRCERNGPNRPK